MKVPLKTTLFGGIAGLTLTSTSLHGQTNGTWVGAGANPIWGGNANWTPSGQIANGAGATAFFANGFANGRTVNLNTNRTIGHVVYTDPGEATAMTLSWFVSQPSVTLTLNAPGSTPSFNVTQPDRTLTVTARLGGTNGFSKLGPGTMVLGTPGSEPNHPISGPVTIQEGILEIRGGLGLSNSVFDTANSILGDATNGLRTDFVTLALGGLSGDKDLATLFTTTNGGYHDELISLALNPGASVTSTYSGVISDGMPSMALFKSGAGTQILDGANTYTGMTFVTAGTLALGANGSIDGSRSLILEGGTFDVSAKAGGYAMDLVSGSGTVLGDFTVSTELSPGNSFGVINFENLAFANGAQHAFHYQSGSTQADLVNVSGTLNLNDADLLVLPFGSFANTLGEKFTLFAYETGNLTGTFSGLNDGDNFTTDSGIWRIFYADTTPGLNGGVGDAFVTITAIPEPSAVFLGAIGMVALLRRRRGCSRRAARG